MIAPGRYVALPLRATEDPTRVYRAEPFSEAEMQRTPKPLRAALIKRSKDRR